VSKESRFVDAFNSGLEQSRRQRRRNVVFGGSPIAVRCIADRKDQEDDIFLRLGRVEWAGEDRFENRAFPSAPASKVGATSK